MPLETAAFLSDLNPSNPAATDRIQQGDDHIRLIKAALKATFPNLKAAMTLTADQLNSVTGNLVPFGVIVDWYGSASAVPSGWAVCNGQSVAKTDGSGNITTPDLRGRVTEGASDVHASGSTRGSELRNVTSSAAGGHAHTAGIPDHAHGAAGLTVSVDRAQTGISVTGSPKTDTAGGGSGRTLQYDPGLAVNDPGHVHGASLGGTTAAGGAANITTSGVGDHTHAVGFDVIQPTMALHKIMKI